MADYNFSGWVTQYNIKCTDGRTIRDNAFAHMDGERVPLVSNHVHDDPEKWLGYVDLEHVSGKGLYGRASLNNNPKAQAAKEAVAHGDVNSFSIYANHLKQMGGNVIHGDVKEVSLVLCGANSGAKIDYPVLNHSGMVEFMDGESIDYADEFEDARITFPDSIAHADANEADDISIADVYESMTDEQKAVVGWYFEQGVAAGAENAMSHADEDGEVEEEIDEATEAEIDEFVDSIIDATIDAVLDELESDELEDGEDAAHSEFYNEGDYEMKSNIFEARVAGGQPQQIALSHSEFAEIISYAADHRESLANVFKGYIADNYLQHGDDDEPYGIKDIEILFPDAKLYQNEPGFIKRKTEWVSKVLGAVSKRPFAKVKTRHADITKDEARAKGYTKGNKKLEEVFELLQRQTGPTTIYKKQKIDRDDKIDITDFNVVNFIKKEMRMMLDEEIARAILIGDGRSKLSQDKIKEDCIRPVVSDDALYCIKAAYTYETDSDPDVDEANKARAFIRKVIKARKEYRGAGNPALYTTEDMITACLLLEDGVGRPLYDTEEKLRTKLRVSEIVTIPVMEGLTRDDGAGHTFDVDAILVNLSDYVCGADKGGEINTFEDFDIDYNQEKFLMETRMSGALVEPYSAIVFERARA